jgi:hypothetical protein
MVAIATDNQLTTVISFYSVIPARQAELIEKLITYLQVIQQQQGFFSASIHQSLDGEKVCQLYAVGNPRRL